MRRTSFLWKLTENYFNSIMVLVLSILVVYSIVYKDTLSFYLAILWILACPFFGTFIDMKSNGRPKKRK
jgi:hypothetical protein